MFTIIVLMRESVKPLFNANPAQLLPEEWPITLASLLCWKTVRKLVGRGNWNGVSPIIYMLPRIRLHTLVGFPTAKR